MGRAPKFCGRASCSNKAVAGVTYCPEHTQAWAGSTRRQRLPRDWPQLRAAVLTRDGGVCHVCGGPGADEVDHVVPGDNHRLENLAAIHDRPCHRRKSAREGNAARGRSGSTDAPIDRSAKARRPTPAEESWLPSVIRIRR
jgi:5-methylcytosine-specific restriction enzyme A